MSMSEETKSRLSMQSKNSRLKSASDEFLEASVHTKYSYNFTWLGRPIIQYPQDIVMIQQLIWKIRPTLIVETGVAHGGSLILSASMLQMIEFERSINRPLHRPDVNINPLVVGIDIDIRDHNRNEIERHPMSRYIRLIQGSSIDSAVMNEVLQLTKGHQTIMVILDSNHTHDHVLAELRFYGGLVTRGSYCIVFDTLIEDMPPNTYPDRSWDKGNNPATAVEEYLSQTNAFTVDFDVNTTLQVTAARSGYLKRVS